MARLVGFVPLRQTRRAWWRSIPRTERPTWEEYTAKNLWQSQVK